MFQVDAATAPAKGQHMSGFQPKYSDYAVVVLSYQTAGASPGSGLVFGVRAE